LCRPAFPICVPTFSAGTSRLSKRFTTPDFSRRLKNLLELLGRRQDFRAEHQQNTGHSVWPPSCYSFSAEIFQFAGQDRRKRRMSLPSGEISEGRKMLLIGFGLLLAVTTIALLLSCASL
jgi:hypothetical protein